MVVAAARDALGAVAEKPMPVCGVSMLFLSWEHDPRNKIGINDAAIKSLIVNAVLLLYSTNCDF